MKSTKRKNHKWNIINKAGDKACLLCGSKINFTTGKVKYVERDEYGILDAVNWYPRCIPPKNLKIDKE